MIDACRTVSWLMLVLAFLLVASSSPVRQYSMTVESSAAVGTGGRVYRFFVML